LSLDVDEIDILWLLTHVAEVSEAPVIASQPRRWCRRSPVLAAVINGFAQAIGVHEVADPVVQDATDVVVSVRAAGVCRTDLETMAGGMAEVYGVPAFPYVVGHETVGVVADVGSAVRSVVPGDAVLLHPLTTCGLCVGCRSGRDTYCSDSRFAGVDGRTQGGWAESVRVGERALVKVPHGANFAALAPLTDAGLTAHHAVERVRWALRPDAQVVVLGLGGVGLFGLQLLRAATNAQITAIDAGPDRVELGRPLGADDVLTGDLGVDAESLHAAMSGRPADVVLDFAKSSITLDAAKSAAEAAGQHAQELGVPSTIAVVDESGGLVVLLKMQGAILTSGQMATDKAWTAAATGGPTAQWHGIAQEVPALGFGLGSITRFCPLAGGLPIVVNGELVGGIGSSGGSLDQDAEIAQAGLASLG